MGFTVCRRQRVKGSLEQSFPMISSDDSRVRRKMSRKEKRKQRRQYTKEQCCGDNHPLNIGVDELKSLQESDTTLQSVRKAANRETCSARGGFFLAQRSVVQELDSSVMSQRYGC